MEISQRGRRARRRARRVPSTSSSPSGRRTRRLPIVRMNCAAHSSSGCVGACGWHGQQRAAMRRIERLLRDVAGDGLVLLEPGAGHADVRRPDRQQPERRLSGSMRPATTMSAPSTSAMLALYCAAVSRRMAIGPPTTAGDAVRRRRGWSVGVDAGGAVAVGIAVGISVGTALAGGSARGVGDGVGTTVGVGARHVPLPPQPAAASSARRGERQRPYRADLPDARRGTILDRSASDVSSRDEGRDGLEAIADRQRRAAAARLVVVAVGLRHQRGVETRAGVAERQAPAAPALRPKMSYSSAAGWKPYSIPCADAVGPQVAGERARRGRSGRRRRSGC